MMRGHKLSEDEVIDVLLGDADPESEARGRAAFDSDPRAAALRDEWAAILPVVHGERQAARRIGDRVHQQVMEQLTQERAVGISTRFPSVEPNYGAFGALLCGLLGPGRFSPRRRMVTALAVALPLIAVAGLFSFQHNRAARRVTPMQIVGDVHYVVGVDLPKSVTDQAFALPSRVTVAGDGFARLRLAGGTELRLSENTTVALDSRLRARQFSGRAVYVVSAADSRGEDKFTVDGPKCRIVDQGTEFQVSIKDHDIAVIKVLSGTVRIDTDEGTRLLADTDDIVKLEDGIVTEPGGSDLIYGETRASRMEKPMVLWQQAVSPASWSARSGHTSLVHDGKIWVMGGDDAGLGFTSDVWSTDDGDTWSQVAPAAPWGPRTGHASVVFRGAMWVLGGDAGTERRSDVWHSVDGVEWEQVTPKAPWPGRRGHAAVVQSGRLWVIGGSIGAVGGGGRLNDVWHSQDGIDWVRSTSEAPWAARSDHAAVAHGARIWILGGDVGSSGANDVWSSMDGENWDQVGWEDPTSPTPRWSPRMGHTVASLKGKLWLLGGVAGGRKTNEVWCSADGRNWVDTADWVSWAPRGGHATVVRGDRLWVLGGSGAEDLISDVWH